MELVNIFLRYLRMINELLINWSGVVLLGVLALLLAVLWRSRRNSKLIELLELYLEAFKGGES